MREAKNKFSTKIWSWLTKFTPSPIKQAADRRHCALPWLPRLDFTTKRWGDWHRGALTKAQGTRDARSRQDPGAGAGCGDRGFCRQGICRGDGRGDFKCRRREHAQTDPNEIGFIYVGPTEDFGYNMSMDLGRIYLEETLAGIETTAFEAIPETAEVERVMERLIQSGHRIIFATSYGHLNYAISLGQRYHDVAFLHAGGLRTSDNVGTFWADSDDGTYLAGVIAGHMSEDGKLGFIGAFQIPKLFGSINAFTLGA